MYTIHIGFKINELLVDTIDWVLYYFEDNNNKNTLGLK
jgi:hypothetical protein